MNPAKFITTVLGTALYTSSWWCLAIADKNFVRDCAWAVIPIVSVTIGTIGGVVLAGVSMVENWNKKD